MTQQFKFGDRVIDKDTRLGECVVINASENFVYIMNEQGSYNTIARPESLELIPHPDTVRLDWLVENDCALTEKLCDEDGDIHPTPNAVIQKQEDHFEVLAATSNNIREAIDVAMAYIDSKR
ncbi:hypothetical protein [Neisseria sicca]|uniref:hypothetical protein n=1 Tax=Neisseria sicca TaxID=490 RepID=UPI003FA11D1C